MAGYGRPEWDETDDDDRFFGFRIDPETSREDLMGDLFVAFGEPNEAECDMCGKPNGVVRGDGQRMCQQCWDVWNS